MQIKTKKTKGILTFMLEGELDEHASHNARSLLDKEISMSPAPDIVFDLNRLSFMDSTGIGVLLGRYKRLCALDKKAYITGACPAVNKVLTAGGVYRVIQRL